MKVLYWTPFFWPDIGGIEVLAMRTLPALQKRGYQFIVVTSYRDHDLPAETSHNDIPVYRFPFWDALANHSLSHVLKIRQQVSRLKRSFKPDLVHLHCHRHPAYFHLNTLEAHSAPTLLTVHADLLGTRATPDTLVGQTLRSADWVTAVSKATLADVHQLVPDTVTRSSVIYNGFEAPELPPAPLPYDPPRVLCIGRLAHNKGFDLALTAFATLTDRYPGVGLTIAGDGPARSELEQQAAALGLAQTVEFAGWVDPERVPALLNRATVVVIPTRYREPFALVAVEAANMARAVVATRIGGLTETVVHQQTGLLIEKEDSKALAEAVAFLLDNPDIARRMGQAGRSRASAIFSLENFVNDYDGLYQRLIYDAQKNRSISA